MKMKFKFAGSNALPKAGALALTSGGVWFGLAWPDSDLLALGVLHHRSVVTHSILLPLILMRWVPSDMYAGMLYGISIHLWADSLSTATGFAQVYTPVINIGFGEELSLIWLLGNAVVGFVLATICYKRVPWIAIGAFFLIAGIYAVFNEGAGFLLYVVSIASVFMFVRYVRSRGRFFRRSDKAKE